MDGEKGASYTLFAHAQFPQDFWEFGTTHKICYINLCKACQLLHYERCLPLARLCVEDQGVNKALSSLLDGVVSVFVHMLNTVAHD